MAKNTVQIKLVNMTMKGGIITATTETSKIRKGNKIVMKLDDNTVVECVIIKKLGRQIKARVEKIIIKKSKDEK